MDTLSFVNFVFQHLDIKSSNVLLDSSQRQARLCDFGFAECLDHKQSVLNLDRPRGSPAWMSPEMAAVSRRNDLEVGLATDIYSMGMVLWEVLSGQKPYDGLTVEQVFQRIDSQQPPELRTEFDLKVPGVCDLIATCWSVKAQTRPSAEALHRCVRKMEETAKTQTTNNVAKSELDLLSTYLESQERSTPVFKHSMSIHVQADGFSWG